ncbi:hypothetical protein [Streptomyces sp. NPDC096095]|uniref:hypothetical protein n=1 Tax=Streptomyces sp. NPDC096095 TaxID=3155545 RepID=UPI003322C75B
MVTRPATQWAVVTDDMVLYRAVIDHTAQCETCRAERACPYRARLSQMARVARDISREHREGTDCEITVRVGADTGMPTGPHCRAATLANRPAVHLECGRPSNCACFCHRDGLPVR